MRDPTLEHARAHAQPDAAEEEARRRELAELLASSSLTVSVPR